MGGKYKAQLEDACLFYGSYDDLTPDYMKVAYISLTLVIDHILRHKPLEIDHLADRIASNLEAEQQHDKFKHECKGLDFIDSKDKVVFKKAAKIRSVQKYWKKTNRTWTKWDTKTRIHIGVRFIQCIQQSAPELFEIRKLRKHDSYVYKLAAKDEFYTFVKEHIEFLESKVRVTVPCIEPPLDWERDNDGDITGGFHTNELSRNVGFVKTRSRRQREWLHNHNPSNHLQCVNSLQRTTWEINHDAFVFVRDCVDRGLLPDKVPTRDSLPYPEKVERGDPKFQDYLKEWYEVKEWNKNNTANLLRISNSFSVGNFLLGKPLWFVHWCDYRGRIYAASSSINPQGSDELRGMLRFREGKPLGKSGYKWLAVHGANVYGYNKVNFHDRYQWVMDNEEGIRAVASRPDSSAGRELLNGASKPVQFYAFCREWAEVSTSRDPSTFLSHLPVAQDGSCNGLQHYSALLGDAGGAGRTGLVKSEVPADIYRTVADTFRGRLARDTDYHIEDEVLTAIDREFVKPIVMTLPYGITRRGVSLEIYKQLKKEDWSLITHMTDVIMQVVNQEIPSYKYLKEWLEDASNIFSSRGDPIKWVTPAGFPVMQDYRATRELSIRTEFFGTKVLKFREEKDGIDVSQSRTAIAPNYIHSMDSSHLVFCINAAVKKGIQDFSVIHDSIAVHACHVHEMREVIKEQFMYLYLPDVLEGVKQQWTQNYPIPDQPKKGNYDISEILDATYFYH